MKLNVKQCKKKYLKQDYLVAIFILFILATIIINPAKYSAVAFKGIEVWIKILVPSLFPFFVLTKIFSSTNFLNDLTKIFEWPTKKIYKCPPCSSYIFFISAITGYPVGAKLTQDMHNEGRLSNTDAKKTLSFCLNSGPMFILGSVAIGMFKNKQMGIIIYLSHVIGSLINGLLYRGMKSSNTKNKTIISMQKANFAESINSSISSIMLIGGVICFTFVLIEVISSTFVFNIIVKFFSCFGLNEKIIHALLCGVFEITNGCLMLSNLSLSINILCPLLTFIISFGGISTLLQALAFVKDIVPAKLLILQKFTHAICSTFICCLFLLFL